MRRSLIDTNSTVVEPDVTEETVSDAQTQQEAETLADEYLPFVDAGYASVTNRDAAQPLLNRFVEGWTYQKDKSTSENAVFYHESDQDAIVTAQGTTGVGDAAKTWREVSSEGQSLLTTAAAMFFPGVAAAATVGAAGVNTFSGTQSVDERVASMHAMIDLVQQERGADANILLIGHSLGGAIVRQTMAEHPDEFSSIVYNSAVGKHDLSRNNTSKNIEVRIRHDVVSTSLFEKVREYTIDRGFFRGPLSAHSIEMFSKDPAFYKRVRDGEISLRPRSETIRERDVREESLPDFVRTTMRRKRANSVYEDFVSRHCKPGYRFNGRQCAPFF